MCGACIMYNMVRWHTYTCVCVRDMDIMCVGHGYVCSMYQGSLQWCVYSWEFWHIRKLLVKGF